MTPSNGRGAAAPAPTRLLVAGVAVLLAALVASAVVITTGAQRGAVPARAAVTMQARLDSLPTATSVTPVAALGSTLPADCIPKLSGPPGSPYQLGLVGTVRNGTLKAGNTTVANISAAFCAVVTLVNGTPPCGATGTVAAPEDGQTFGKIAATLTLVPGMKPSVPFTAHPGEITGGFACGSSQGGLSVSLTAVVSGSTGLFGLSCTIGPLTIPLSGVLTGPLTDASVTLAGNDFPVPAVGSSTTCAGQVPSQIDAIAGLPIPAGEATITLPATASLYRPAA